MAHQAQDTFVASMPDGSERLITKGQVLADSDPLVKRDTDGSGGLFQPLDVDGDEKPARGRRGAAAESKGK